jgi:hypothetical protein
VGYWYLAFVAVIVVGSLAGIAAASRRNARLSRRLDAGPAPPLVIVRGNMWSPGIGGSFGFFSRLEFFDWGVRLRSGPSLPRYDVRWGELTEVQVGRLVWPGVKLSSPVFSTPVYFETFEPLPRLLASFAHHGVPVNLESVRFPLWSTRHLR